jgi:PPM family protein phosphatase
MGGHHGGDVASAVAVDVLGAMATASSVSVDGLRSALAAANGLIFDRSGRGDRTMGTTVSGIAVTNEPASPIAVFNVGDSRTYLLDGGVMRQMTRDHSYVQELVDAGQISASDADRHPERNVVTRALGVEATVAVDVTRHAAVPGQRWLICSDGLTELAPDRIAACLQEPDAQASAERLVAETLAGPARDNVSVVVVDVVTVDEIDDPDRTDPRRGARAPAADTPALIDGVPDFLKPLTGSEPR